MAGSRRNRRKPPRVCLNMIVRDEAHIIAETLDSVAPVIDSWVIVDTGSTDGTQQLIGEHMAKLGIKGVLHERPWVNFGHNRTEALVLGRQSGADYLLVMDADDLLEGTLDLSGLTADVGRLRLKSKNLVYWRPQLFRTTADVVYRGVVHEYADTGRASRQHVSGDYAIISRRLGARSKSDDKFARDRDLLLAEVERNPDDARSTFYLAQSYRDLGDHANALRWYRRRIELGGWAGEVFYSMYQSAATMERLEEPWPDVLDAYLRAWEFAPTRAEPLYVLARHYRTTRQFRLGYLFAKRATQIPLPEGDLFVDAGAHSWRSRDELAICASRTGRAGEAFRLCREVLARTDIPDDARRRIAANRDFSVPAMIDAAIAYPDQGTAGRIGGGSGEVTVSVVAGPQRGDIERTLNSLLNCCTDLSTVGRLLILDAGLSAADRKALTQRYPAVEFAACAPDDGDYTRQLQKHVTSRFWLHVGIGWVFFAPEDLIGRLTGLLDAEPDVIQAGVNLDDATALTGASAPEATVRRGERAGRYVPTTGLAQGPAMFDTDRLERVGDASNPATATLDEVLCVIAADG